MLAHLRARCEPERELQAASVPLKLQRRSAEPGSQAPWRIAPLKAHMTNDNSMTRRQFVAQTAAAVALSDSRSEEHTSELQSRSDLVCRLLLEKKKIEQQNQTYTH